MNQEDVRQMRQVTFVMSQVACAYAEIEAMKAENTYRERRGEVIAWDHDAFMAVHDKYGLGHNSALTTLNGGAW